MNLTTITRVQAFDPSISPTVADAQVTALITAVSAEMERMLDRKVLTDTYTEYFSPHVGQVMYSLPAYPITSITSVTYDPDRLFTDSNDILDTTDYTHDADTGMLYIDGEEMAIGNRTLKVVWVGGMGADEDAFIAAYPDLAMAADLIVANMFHQSTNASITTINDGMASTTIRPIVIPGHARAIIESHKRRLF